MDALTCVEICAGAGGQALGLEQAGFAHEALVDKDPHACQTLRLNRGSVWKVVEDDIANMAGRAYQGVDLLAGGVPCPPFTIAGLRLGQDDERDKFPQALRLVREARPRAVLLENVPGLARSPFESYRAQVRARLEALGYQVWWDLILASEHGVPQLRPRFVLVAIKRRWAGRFNWPEPSPDPPPAVGDVLIDLMAARGWPGAAAWRAGALRTPKGKPAIAPTIVGGSERHGGPDLGPTRAREAWAALGVDGRGVADEAPGPDFPAGQMPKLTARCVARIQGFPDDWDFAGRKTAAYRQIGNAFPPPPARALGVAIRTALSESRPAGRRGCGA